MCPTYQSKCVLPVQSATSEQVLYHGHFERGHHRCCLISSLLVNDRQTFICSPLWWTLLGIKDMKKKTKYTELHIIGSTVCLAPMMSILKVLLRLRPQREAGVPRVLQHKNSALGLYQSCISGPIQPSVVHIFSQHRHSKCTFGVRENVWRKSIIFFRNVVK